jgi:hypothetical protein
MLSGSFLCSVGFNLHECPIIRANDVIHGKLALQGTCETWQFGTSIEYVDLATFPTPTGFNAMFLRSKQFSDLSLLPAKTGQS